MDEAERMATTDTVPGSSPYSTLEVDQVANHREKLLKSPSDAAEYGANVLPQVGANPENLPEATHPEAGTENPPSTTRGTRKRTLWILSALVLLLVIGAAVGGGVGTSLTKKDSSLPATAFLPNTNLAAVNFTEDSVDHRIVFFQTAGDGIYQSAWNSSRKSWTVSPVNIKGSNASRSDIFKTPTPISASFYACSSNTPNLTLYFLDASSRLRQLQTSNPADFNWTPGPLDTTINIPADSHLASYSCQHPSYADYSDAWFQGSDGFYEVVDASGNPKDRVDDALAMNANITIRNPPANSSLTLVPHYIYDYNRTAKAPWVSLFFVDSEILWQYHYRRNRLAFMRHFDGSNQPRLPDNTNIAGFSWGYNKDIPNVGGLQVLYTMPDESAGGISYLQMNKIDGEGIWESIDATNANNPFKGVASYSSVAATEVGSVYAVVEDKSSGEVELREWEWVQQDLKYTERGAVNTEVPRT
ncbi:fungal fucose-specific lectin protein [Diplodia corticola]|uniref:Fungal fucose-specific lectin protein n=1 Tax=Diplodia corticola TaxID=236234 RepID=A0A1J9R144_9PEZI|nr:fungal fucose-specific lectin protein [Diplodia corticola]OJD34329.1 fungal fucose-specific lectin protein [Diplodia corticola]